MHVQSVQKYCFFIVKYANLWGFCCRRRRGYLSSLILSNSFGILPKSFSIGQKEDSQNFLDRHARARLTLRLNLH